MQLRFFVFVFVFFFLVITGYWGLILHYGELAWPLNKLTTKTQQTKTDKLLLSPDTQKAFKDLQTTLLQYLNLSMLTGSECNLFVTERKGMTLGILTQP